MLIAKDAKVLYQKTIGLVEYSHVQYINEKSDAYGNTPEGLEIYINPHKEGMPSFDDEGERIYDGSENYNRVSWETIISDYVDSVETFDFNVISKIVITASKDTNELELPRMLELEKIALLTKFKKIEIHCEDDLLNADNLRNPSDDAIYVKNGNLDFLTATDEISFFMMNFPNGITSTKDCSTVYTFDTCAIWGEINIRDNKQKAWFEFKNPSLIDVDTIKITDVAKVEITSAKFYTTQDSIEEKSQSIVPNRAGERMEVFHWGEDFNYVSSDSVLISENYSPTVGERMSPSFLFQNCKNVLILGFYVYGQLSSPLTFKNDGLVQVISLDGIPKAIENLPGESIFVDSCTEVTISNVTFPCINIFNCATAAVSTVTIAGLAVPKKYGVRMAKIAKEALVASLKYMKGSVETGVLVSFVSGDACVIGDSVFSDLKTAISITGTEKSALVSSCTFENVEVGINVKNTVDDISVNNCVFSDCGKSMKIDSVSRLVSGDSKFLGKKNVALDSDDACSIKCANSGELYFRNSTISLTNLQVDSTDGITFNETTVALSTIKAALKSINIRKCEMDMNGDSFCVSGSMEEGFVNIQGSKFSFTPKFSGFGGIDISDNEFSMGITLQGCGDQALKRTITKNQFLASDISDSKSVFAKGLTLENCKGILISKNEFKNSEGEGVLVVFNGCSFCVFDETNTYANKGAIQFGDSGEYNLNHVIVNKATGTLPAVQTSNCWAQLLSLYNKPKFAERFQGQTPAANENEVMNKGLNVVTTLDFTIEDWAVQYIRAVNDFVKRAFKST